jgi:hypothetical protein
MSVIRIDFNVTLLTKSVNQQDNGQAYTKNSTFTYLFIKFKVFKFGHHHTIQINQPNRRNNFSSLLLEIYLQLNMFRASSLPSSGIQQLQ